jgi:PAS domain-containing protein
LSCVSSTIRAPSYRVLDSGYPSRRRLGPLRMPDSLTDLAGLGVGAEGFLAAVLEAAAQPIWVVDPDDVIRFANPAAIDALGYPKLRR